MHDFLITPLTLSLSGSLIALLLFTIKRLSKGRLSQTWQYCIWLLVLLRLMIATGPEWNLMQTVGNLYGESIPLHEIASPKAVAGEPYLQDEHVISPQPVEAYIPQTQEAVPVAKEVG